MSKQSKNAFSKIPSNQPATYKQVRGVASRLAELHCKASGLEIKKHKYMMSRRFGAILNQLHQKAGAPLTHQEIQKLFKVTEVPQKYVTEFRIAAPKVGSNSPTKKQLEQDKKKLLALLELNGIEIPNDDEDSKQLDLFE